MQLHLPSPPHVYGMQFSMQLQLSNFLNILLFNYDAALLDILFFGGW